VALYLQCSLFLFTLFLHKCRHHCNFDDIIFPFSLSSNNVSGGNKISSFIGYSEHKLNDAPKPWMHTQLPCAPTKFKCLGFYRRSTHKPKLCCCNHSAATRNKKIRAEGFVDATVGPSAILEIDDSLQTLEFKCKMVDTKSVASKEVNFFLYSWLHVNI